MSMVATFVFLCSLVFPPSAVHSYVKIPAGFIGYAKSVRLSATVEGRKYSSYNIYKGKGALAVKVISPTWTQLSGGTSYVVAREGGLLFEFAPAGSVQKEYDWNRKNTFLMDATECGELLTNEKESSGLEFFHDPGALTATAGQMTKKMKWTLMPDRKGVFVSLTVTDKVNSANSGTLSIPLSWGEFMVIDSIIRFSIPRFLGIDQSFGQPGVTYFGGRDESAPTPPPAPAYKQIL